ncbi:hypothetical protein HanPI659440_Chr16g0659481 [Helianthus annuus]|nr:hypothetical protein HanPI659440_Chr16g0659481 [Helianthus annuus]
MRLHTIRFIACLSILFDFFFFFFSVCFLVCICWCLFLLKFALVSDVDFLVIRDCLRFVCSIA